MPLAEQAGIGIVVDHDQIRSPADGHGEAGGEDQFDAPCEGRRPGSAGPNGVADQSKSRTRARISPARITASLESRTFHAPMAHT